MKQKRERVSPHESMHSGRGSSDRRSDSGGATGRRRRQQQQGQQQQQQQQQQADSSTSLPTSPEGSFGVGGLGPALESELELPGSAALGAADTGGVCSRLPKLGSRLHTMRALLRGSASGASQSRTSSGNRSSSDSSSASSSSSGGGSRWGLLKQISSRRVLGGGESMSGGRLFSSTSSSHSTPSPANGGLDLGTISVTDVSEEGGDSDDRSSLALALRRSQCGAEQHEEGEQPRGQHPPQHTGFGRTSTAVVLRGSNRQNVV